MKTIGEIDKNFQLQSEVNKENIRWVNACDAPITTYGIFHDGKQYKRMDSQVAQSVSEGVALLHTCTSGGRITLETDSPYLAIAARGDFWHMSHMAITGSTGFDLYVLEDGAFHFYASLMPPADQTDGYTAILEFPDSKKRKLLIHFPLYCGVISLHLGFDAEASLASFHPYKDKAPVVYYGSIGYHTKCNTQKQ